MMLLATFVVPEPGRLVHGAGPDTPMTAVWSGIGLRDWAARVGELARLPVLLDHRLDPDTPIRLECREEPLRDVIARVADVAHGEVAMLRSSIWIVTHGRAALVSRAEQAREARLASLSPRHRSTLDRKSRCQWTAGARPRDVVRQMAAQAGIVLEGIDTVPHDHLPAASLPELSLAEKLDLVLSPFDLRVDWHAAAGATGVPQPTGRIIRIDSDLPPEEETAVRAAVTVAKPSAAGKPSGRPVRGGRNRNAERQTFSLQVAAPLDELLAACAARLNLTVDLDRESLRSRAIAPGEIVRLTVEDATREELLDAILGPLDLSWTISDGTLRVFAR